MECEDWESSRSLVRSLKILLAVETAGLVLTLTAGASLIAQLGEFSQCILFSYKDGESLSFGEEYYCEVVGYGLVVTVMIMFVIICLTVSQISAISAHHSQYVLRKLRCLRITWRSLSLHLAMFLLTLAFSAVSLAGYFASCSTFHRHVSQILEEKLNQDPRVVRGENIQERFVDDVGFWRYTRQVRNPYGANLYILDCSCRALLTDPDIATVLHDNHWAKYSGYYGYWYSQDIYNTDSTAKATSTNALVEASITTCCLSCLAWLGATIFLIILKRRTERRAKCQTDSIHLKSKSPSSARKSPDRFYPVITQDSGVFGSQTVSVMSSSHGTSRRDIDSLALGSILDPGLWRGAKRSQRLSNLNTGKIAQLKPLLKTAMQTQAYETEIL